MTGDIKNAMPAKKQATKRTTVVTLDADAANLVQPPPAADAPLANEVLDRVLQRLDLDGLLQKVMDEAAIRLAKRIHVDSLIESLVGQHEQQLSDRLAQRILEHFAQNGTHREQVSSS
jgi:hypothetical protein